MVVYDIQNYLIGMSDTFKRTTRVGSPSPLFTYRWTYCFASTLLLFSQRRPKMSKISVTFITLHHKQNHINKDYLFSGQCQESSSPNTQISETGAVSIPRRKGGEATIKADLTQRAIGWQNDNSSINST
jgi:hypothetical protein